MMLPTKPTMMAEHDTGYSVEVRRKAARKTALIMALIAAGIFVAFMLKGILG